jgi:Gram-negative bacterial TonB protein C-terminal
MSLRFSVSAATVIVAVLVGACASSGSKTASAESDCALRPQDSTFAAHIPLYRECAVQRRAREITTGINPDFQPTSRGNGCYSAEIEFVVTASGTPDATTARVVRTNTPELADAALKVIPRFRYEPAQRDGAPVAQIVLRKFEMITKIVMAPAGQRPNPGRPGPGC